jgi:hypothetical protein
MGVLGVVVTQGVVERVVALVLLYWGLRAGVVVPLEQMEVLGVVVRLVLMGLAALMVVQVVVGSLPLLGLFPILLGEQVRVGLLIII